MKPTLLVIGVIIGSALTIVVLAAIAANSLWTLIGGVIVIGVITIGLSWIGVNLFSRYTDAVLRRNEIDYRHAENTMKLGYVPENRRMIYTPIQQPTAIEAPKQVSPANQIILNPNALQTSAVNLLLFSCRLLGDNSNRIASGPECAAAGVIGYSGRTWSLIIHDYLEKNYGVVTVTGKPDNGGGTYIPDNIGTCKKLYDLLVMRGKQETLDSAVDALPEYQR